MNDVFAKIAKKWAEMEASGNDSDAWYNDSDPIWSYKAVDTGGDLEFVMIKTPRDVVEPEIETSWGDVKKPGRPLNNLAEKPK